MAKLSLVVGTTNKLLTIFIQKSGVGDGSGITGLLYGAAGLTCYYYREGAVSAGSIPLQTMTLGTWVSGGFIVVDNTNMPGVYQLGIPNAVLAAGAKSVSILLWGAANMAPVPLEIELTATDNQTAAIVINSPIKKNLAFNNFTFLMLDLTGSPASGLSVTGQVSIDGAAFQSLTNAITELSNGVYKVNLAAADTNGVSSMTLRFTASGAQDSVITVLLVP